ncbi:hypothetical protein [Paenibacillus medicaginis]|uniref:LPXTG cell wall anchor domain-containing protein n=1 Tax=Paenibacillus medicaginis TaxID=1470560 RepID=A0ABV5BX20_9BACL
MNRKFLAMIMAWMLVLQMISGAGVLPISADDSTSAPAAATVTENSLPVQLTGLVILILGIWLKFRKRQSKE